ncbi:acyltransferase [Acetobacter conturbans]|uniref:Acyltransferase n=1 Tax=Acetobacter conturbans TaxID=1737472 RepID=A0ABX0K2W9_9PROT|nr:acyltransferase [Acetobacter conturbans]NHN87804.1 acyltransferase [Acetobacter conturbans]
MPFPDHAIMRHLRRICLAGLGSELVPAFVRTRMLNKMGAKLAFSACIWSGCRIRSSKIVMGPGSFINVGFFFDGAASLVIGKNVRVGQFFKVVTATHNIGPENQRCLIEAVLGDVIIEDGCWIGANVTILPGVRIRRGCVIGANSLVRDSTEPNGVYVGSPAKRVRDLPLDAPVKEKKKPRGPMPSPLPSFQRAGATSL